MQNIKHVPLGVGQLTAAQLASAIALPSIPAGSTVAIITVDTASVKWRDDNTAPTATVGMTIRDTDPPFEYWGDLATLEFIAVSGSPVLNVAYYKIVG